MALVHHMRDMTGQRGAPGRTPFVFMNAIAPIPSYSRMRRSVLIPGSLPPCPQAIRPRIRDQSQTR